MTALAGWSRTHQCKTGDPGCRHLDCDGCGASDVAQPGAKVPAHRCPKTPVTEQRAEAAIVSAAE